MANATINTNSLEFFVAYELTIEEFCAICEKKGMTLEQTKKAIIENAEAIAERIKAIMPA